MVKSLEYIAAFFDKFTVTEEKVNAWHEVFKSYSAKDFRQAITDYVGGNKYPPTPNDIRNAYWELINKRQARAREELQKASKQEYCKYCEGTGYFYRIDDYGRQVAPCKCSGNPYSLNKALADEKWYWSDEKRAFLPRKGWVGEW